MAGQRQGGAEEPSPPLLVKIVMAGESCVGKTSIVRRYTDPGSLPFGAPTSSYLATIGIDFKVKAVTFNDTRVKLQIWDTAGQERFHTLSTSYFRGAQGFVLVYDITNLDSFQNITSWMRDIHEMGKLDVKRIKFFQFIGEDNVCEFRAFPVTLKPQDGAFVRWCPCTIYFIPYERSRKLCPTFKAGDEVDVILLGNKCDKESERVVPKQKGEKLAWEHGIPFFETSAKDNVNIEEAFSVLTKYILEKNSCLLYDSDVVSLNESKKRTCCAF